MPKEKTFFNVGTLSEEFAHWDNQRLTVKDVTTDSKTRLHLELLIFTLRAQLAQAQQLAVISGHLADIANALGFISENAAKR